MINSLICGFCGKEVLDEDEYYINWCSHSGCLDANYQAYLREQNTGE